MTFKQDDKESFVWIWLPNETTPIVCGKLDANSDSIVFNYGKSYLNNHAAIPIYEPELPLQPGILPLTKNLIIANCIRDAAPDAWGRRVIINKLMGSNGTKIDTNVLNELTYLLQSGSDRIGALDFQRSAHVAVCVRRPPSLRQCHLQRSAHISVCVRCPQQCFQVQERFSP